MSAMAEMVADMLLKALPENVRAMLTAENLNALQAKIVEKWMGVETSLATIVTAQNATIETLMNMVEHLEQIDGRLAALEVKKEPANGGRSHHGKPNGSVGGSSLITRDAAGTVY